MKWPRINVMNIKVHSRSFAAKQILLLAGFQLRRELRHHLLEFRPLLRIENLKDAISSRGAQIVELVFQALVVMAVVFEDAAELLSLLGRKIQAIFEILQNGYRGSC